MLTAKQQLIHDWLVKLRLPVYAKAYIGAVRLLKEKSPGYGTFVSHTGRDIVNSLARAVIGIQGGRVQYEQMIDILDRNWRPEWRNLGSASLRENGDGHMITVDVCEMITDLIEKHKEGRRRNQESGELFISTFLDYTDKDRESVHKKWRQLQQFFVGCAHLREENLSDDLLSTIESSFRILEDEFLYIAAVRENSRLKTLDRILEETNKSRNKPNSSKVKKAVERALDKSLELFKHESDRQHFFSNLINPRWIKPLFSRGGFKSPPAARPIFERYVQYPVWPELQYLKNVTKEVPAEVVDIVSNIPQTDNPSVYNDVLDIALMLKGEQSVRLKPKITEYADLGYYLLPNRFADLLAHWTAENETQTTLELAKTLVRFYPDPRGEEKRRRHAENSQDDDLASMDTFLEPAPRFDDWNYHEIMDKGVRPLAEKEPYEVTCMLIDATAHMICLATHQDELERGLRHDSSEIWCPKLEEQRRNSAESKETLVNTLVIACKEIYAQLSNESIASLDRVLGNQRWHVFERIRQHLYTLHPNDQTKPWILELILNYEDYAKGWSYPYEFQRMVKQSCERFGDALLTEDERIRIFDLVLSGPEKEAYREWIGDQFNEAVFEQWTREYHRLQLRPFDSCLFGKYASYYKRLCGDETKDEITDEAYLSFRTSEGGTFSYRSPRSPAKLSSLSDEDLLEYINEWHDEHSDKDDWTIKINVPALAGAFQYVFTRSIIPDKNRLEFWIGENRTRIKRPIFVEHMIQAMHGQVEARDFEQLNRWIDFCIWVLSHPDEDREEAIRYHDELREDLSWRSSRRAVVDFIEVCLKKEVNVPISAREEIATILNLLCNQFDWGLDRKPNRKDPFTDAINSTRGRALRNLFEFGYWVRRHDKTEVPEITSVLEQRFHMEKECPLTVPEYALLGGYYVHIYNFNTKWAVDHREHFFPQDRLEIWQAAFENHLLKHDPHKQILDLLRDDYVFALEHLVDLRRHKLPGQEMTDVLGAHLFRYYTWDQFPLTGADSLLDRFYQKTDGKRSYWANLFDHVGRLLRNIDTQLDESIKNRVMSFFEWRLKAGEPKELREFDFWLKAECLEAEWRLNAYLSLLDVPDVLNSAFGERRYASLHTMSLRKLIPGHTAQVIRCFARLIQVMPEDEVMYIPTDDAKAILRAGRNHEDENINEISKQTWDAMLRGGHHELLDLDE